MGWKRLLLVAVLLGSGLVLGTASAANAVKCSPAARAAHACADAPIVHASRGRHSVIIRGGITKAGGRIHVGPGPTIDIPPAGTDGDCPPNLSAAICNGTVATVTIHDIAHFKPRPGTDHMQPNGWIVVGLDTNFYATVPSELEQGELLGQPAQVRFFPVAWHWTYGDGTQATLGDPGGTWAAQGLRDFDPTPTSHLYRAKGLYEIDLDIQFAAEYQYAGAGWTPVAGTIDVPANRLTAVAGDAKTVLVNHDCLVNPNGPGC